jgi:hypothetical protein
MRFCSRVQCKIPKISGKYYVILRTLETRAYTCKTSAIVETHLVMLEGVNIFEAT